MALEWDDDLRRGIWPRSGMIWVIAIWTALLIIRPWEMLMPWMADLRVERAYALFALSTLYLSGRRRSVSSMQTIGLVLWALALTLSSALAFEPSTAWDMMYIYMTVFVFYYVIVSAIRTPYQLLFVVICYIVSTALFLSKSQWEYHLHGGHSVSMGVTRLIGINLTYQHPNAVAALAVISLPLSLCLWEARRELTQTWPDAWRKAFTWAMRLYFIIAVSSIILTNSRTGLLAFVVFILLVVLASGNLFRVTSSLAGGLVVMGVIWLLMPESNRHRLETIWAPTQGDINDESAVASAEGRKIGFELGMEMFRRFPATGVGLNNFVHYRKTFLDGGYLAAHNTYASLLGETGLVGGAAFTFFVTAIFANSRRTNQLAKYRPDPIVQLLAKLTVACRRSVILLLFVGLAGDFQGFAPLYWIAAYCFLATSMATAAAQRLQTEASAEISTDRAELWHPSTPILSPGQCN
jgi:O-antigen ligase